MQNRAIAAMFNDIGDMLEIKEESPFRITAYRRAARALTHRSTLEGRGGKAGPCPYNPPHDGAGDRDAVRPL